MTTGDPDTQRQGTRNRAATFKGFASRGAPGNSQASPAGLLAADATGVRLSTKLSGMRGELADSALLTTHRAQRASDRN